MLEHSSNSAGAEGPRGCLEASEQAADAAQVGGSSNNLSNGLSVGGGGSCGSLELHDVEAEADWVSPLPDNSLETYGVLPEGAQLGQSLPAHEPDVVNVPAAKRKGRNSLSPRSTARHISGVWVRDSRLGFMEQIQSDDMTRFDSRCL